MNQAIEELTPTIGRLYRLKMDLKGYQIGDIFLLTGVCAVIDPSLSDKQMASSDVGLREMVEKFVWHYPHAFVASMLCGDKEHKHASANLVFFHDYFELIEV